MWDVAWSLERFEEAIDWFRSKTPLTDEAFDALTERAKRKAFTVAGVTQLDMVADVLRSIDEAIQEGTSLEDWKAAIGPTLESAWAGTVANPGWRLDVIFRTNTQHAYAAGRYAQATDPDVIAARPFWQFDAIIDSRTSPICKAADGTILPADSEWWASHHPPAHFACRSQVITLAAVQAKKLGGVTAKPTKTKAQDGFGLLPSRDEWEPKSGDYPAGLWAEFQKKQPE